MQKKRASTETRFFHFNKDPFNYDIFYSYVKKDYETDFFLNFAE